MQIKELAERVEWLAGNRHLQSQAQGRKLQLLLKLKEKM
jgi:signal transduction histidine kinase